MTYSARDVAAILELQESRIRYWAQTGFIGPSARQGGKPVYTFADVVQLKAAKELIERGVPMQRVRRSLEALRRTLPDLASPASRLRVAADGETMVVVDSGRAFEPTSGQVLFEFDVAQLGERVAAVIGLDARRKPAAREQPQRSPTAHAWFLEGKRLEERGDAAAAAAAYERALTLDPRLAAAHTNLGNLRFSAGDLDAARGSYERALALDPEQAEALFNSGLLYERMGETAIAVALYRRAVRAAPDFPDAHFNLGMLLERAGERPAALEHLERFLGLCKGEDSEYTRAARARLEQDGR